LARRDRSPTVTRFPLTFGQNLTDGADLCDANSPVQSGDAWTTQSLSLSNDPKEPSSNALRLVLEDVAEVTIDLQRAGLDLRKPATITLTTTRAVTIRFVGQGRTIEKRLPVVSGYEFVVGPGR
jgi:hypothetical protein